MPGQVSNFFTAGWIQNNGIQKYPLNLIFCILFFSYNCPFSFNALSSESTFSACPVALTLSHTLAISPSGFIRKVVLTALVTSLPRKCFGCRTSYVLWISACSSESSFILSSFFSINRLWDSTLSLLTPITTAFSASKSFLKQLKFFASRLHPACYLSDKSTGQPIFL